MDQKYTCHYCGATNTRENTQGVTKEYRDNMGAYVLDDLPTCRQNCQNTLRPNCIVVGCAKERATHAHRHCWHHAEIRGITHDYTRAPKN